MTDAFREPMPETCGCCEGVEGLTPQPTINRPGLDQLRYRIGTHATFLETMKARLSSQDFPALARFKTRDSHDATIALLDAWALVADVLTFYQERIANEGYLRTATERRSILELGRLVGYTLRPGVSATVYPAFKMEPGVGKEGEIPKGTRVQSIPGPGEMPQFFETSERIAARSEWNELKPRLSQPQAIGLTFSATGRPMLNTQTLYLEGTATNLKANDLLLLMVNGTPIVQYVQSVESDNVANRTQVMLYSPVSPDLDQEPDEDFGNDTVTGAGTNNDSLTGGSRDDSDQTDHEEPRIDCAFEKLNPLLERLTRPPARPPANRQRLDRSPQQTFKCQSDLPSRLLTVLQPRLKDSLYSAWANLPITASDQVQVFALRVKVAPFGHNAPLRPIRYDDNRGMVEYGEWTIDNPLNQSQPPSASFSASPTSGVEPLAVQLVNQSTGDITAYSWIFSDGSTSDAQNPGSHTFNDAGTYTITLRVSGPGGSATQTTSIAVTGSGPVIG